MGAIGDFLGGLMCEETDTECLAKMQTYEKYAYIGIVAVVAIVVLMMVMKRKGGPSLTF